MASLYRRERSPYWWIEYVDAAGERRQESTKLRHALPGESRKAVQLRNELTAREGMRSASRTGDHRTGNERWSAWVPRFIEQRYRKSPLTYDRVRQSWHNLAAFLDEQAITVPRQLTRQHVRDFIDWRQRDAAPNCSEQKRSTHKAAKNTALLEIKFLALIVDEAIASGFCNSNPCHRLGIGRDEARQKPEITSHEHRFITRALKKEPEWMRVSYKIAWEQGCRFSETRLSLDPVNGSDVDLARNVLRLRTKGKKERAAEVPLSPKLRPLFRRLLGERPGFLARGQKTEDRGQRREFTFDKTVIPRGGAGKAWSNFFRKIGRKHLSFHCTRVSFITRCYRAGIPEPDVMRLVLHASTTVHRIYPRLPAASKHLQEAMQQLSR